MRTTTTTACRACVWEEIANPAKGCCLAAACAGGDGTQCQSAPPTFIPVHAATDPHPRRCKHRRHSSALPRTHGTNASRVAERMAHATWDTFWATHVHVAVLPPHLARLQDLQQTRFARPAHDPDNDVRIRNPPNTTLILR